MKNIFIKIVMINCCLYGVTYGADRPDAREALMHNSTKIACAAHGTLKQQLQQEYADPFFTATERVHESFDSQEMNLTEFAIRVESHMDNYMQHLKKQPEDASATRIKQKSALVHGLLQNQPNVAAQLVALGQIQKSQRSEEIARKKLQLRLLQAVSIGGFIYYLLSLLDSSDKNKTQSQQPRRPREKVLVFEGFVAL